MAEVTFNSPIGAGYYQSFFESILDPAHNQSSRKIADTGKTPHFTSQISTHIIVDTRRSQGQWVDVEDLSALSALR